LDVARMVLRMKGVKKLAACRKGSFMIDLWTGDPPGWNPEIPQKKPNITPYVLNNGQTNSAVIVCPGGGYSDKADHEGAPVAEWLNSIGLSAFVLDYRVAPYRHPCPLEDVKRAVRFVRFNADKWHIDTNKIGVLGFSAGGHVAASAGTLFDAGDAEADDPVNRVSSRPDMMILCYPVISLREHGHVGSKDNLLGEDPPEELVVKMSLETQVKRNTPPVFLWHTMDDPAVPVENSILFAGACRMHNVPFELHIFPHGDHGLGLSEENPQAAQWTTLCATWQQAHGA